MEVNNYYRDAFESFFDPQCIIENFRIIESNKAFRALINMQNDAEPELFINDLAIDRWKSIFAENIEGMRANKIDHVSFTAFMQLNSQRQDEYQIHASSLSNNLNSGLILLTFSNITQKEKLDLIENEQRTMADVLRDISSTLNSTLDFDTILINILDQMARVVPYDSASIMLLDDDQETARIYAARGLYDQRGLIDWRKQGSLQVSQTPILRKMFLSGFPLVVPDTSVEPGWVTTPQTAWINSYAGTPIKARNGTIIGFLNLNSPIQNYFKQNAAERLQAFADHAGIALYNARLLRDLKQSYEDLSQAYDKTLIGWSKALELRDECTEGHTQRVADLTMLICRLFGINEPELTKIRYGVLLHDIGKIGIPDAILNKPGKLNDDEWMVMRKHPDYGREILKDIPFLVDSLDIPYYHHERWDGTGYPCGLRGTEIPLPARIFSVIDVWDGMTNKRPYHDGHTDDEAVKYIQQNSGKHFDPEVVKRFMYYLEQQKQDNFIV